MGNIFEDALHKANVNQNILSQIGFDETADVLEKGKKAQVGEVRDWQGVKMQKTVNGWKPVKDKANASMSDIKVGDTINIPGFGDFNVMETTSDALKLKRNSDGAEYRLPRKMFDRLGIKAKEEKKDSFLDKNGRVTWDKPDAFMDKNSWEGGFNDAVAKFKKLGDPSFLSDIASKVKEKFGQEVTIPSPNHKDFGTLKIGDISFDVKNATVPSMQTLFDNLYKKVKKD